MASIRQKPFSPHVHTLHIRGMTVRALDWALPQLGDRSLQGEGGTSSDSPSAGNAAAAHLVAKSGQLCVPWLPANGM